MSQSKQRAIDIFDFKIENVIFEDIIANKSNKSNKCLVRCNIKYKFSDGSVGRLLMRAPKGFAFVGMSPQYPYDIKKDDRKESLIRGFNCPNSLVSPDSINSYPPDVVRFLENLDLLRKNTYEFIIQKKQFETLKKNCASSYSMFCVHKENAIKPLYEDKKTVTNKNGDLVTYGPHMNPKLVIYNGEDDEKPVVKTLIVGPGNKTYRDMSYDTLPYRNVKGTIVPVYLIDYIYFGGHGTSSYGCSHQIKLWACNFSPQLSSNYKPSIDLLPPHEMKDVDEEVKEDNNDDDLFSNNGDVPVYTPV